MSAALARRVVDHVVIGGGITGAATAFHIRRLQPRSNVLLVEREDALGCGQSAYSAGVMVHAQKCEQTSALVHATTQDVETILTDRDRRRLGSWKPRHGTFDCRDYFVDVNAFIQDYVTSAARGAEGSLQVATGTEVVGSEDTRTITLQSGDTLSHAEVTQGIYNCTGMETPQVLASLLSEDCATLGFANLRSHYWELFVSALTADKIASARKESRMSELSLVYLPGMYLKLSQNDAKIEIGVQEKQSVVVQDLAALSGLSNDSYGELGPVDLLYEQEHAVAEFLGADFFENAEVRAYVNGVSTYTPDGKPVIAQNGKVISASGCCGYGVSWAGGIGKLLAEVGCGVASVPTDFCATRFTHWDADSVAEGAAAFRHSKFQPPTPKA